MAPPCLFLSFPRKRTETVKSMDYELLEALKEKIDGTKDSSLSWFEGPLRVIAYKRFTYTTVQSGRVIPYVIIKWKGSKGIFFNCALKNIHHLQTWKNFHKANQEIRNLLEEIYYEPN